MAAALAQWCEVIRTPEGEMPTFLAAPAGAGPRALVVFFMDAPGIREELREMARRVAAAGHAVALPSLFYRAGNPAFDPAPLPAPLPARMGELVAETTAARVAGDMRALLAQLATDPRVAVDRLGAVGTCMGGRHALRLAADHPGRVRVAASWHGGQLVTPAPDSPHRGVGRARSFTYLACAEHDERCTPQDVAALRAALQAGGVPHEVEVLPRTEHGYTFPSRYCYHEVAAEHTWRRTLTLLRRHLGDHGAHE